jgi:hypothetical protein
VTGHHPGEGRGHDRLVVAAHGEQARGAGAAAEGAVKEGGERPADDGLQFGRHTGQADDGGLARAQEHAGRGAHRVVERFGPDRQPGHLLAEGIEPGLGDDAAGVEVVIAGPHHGAGLFVEHQRHPGAAGHRGQGQVVVRGPEPAGGEQHRHLALDGRSHRRGDLGLDVRQQGHPPHPSAAGRDQPAQPLRVRIKDLAPQQLVADGEDFYGGGRHDRCY